ncbi:putative porin [Hyphococcus formosus]|uniref:putative porin n=1 Tax=Hyphococcus formosus TaxID=3143534 RepID=UPI00398B7EF6
MGRTGLNIWVALVAALICAQPVSAAPEAVDRPDELRSMLTELRAEQANLAEKIDRLEALLNSNSIKSPAGSVVRLQPDEPAITVSDQSERGRPKADATPRNKLDFSGDLQLRYEGNFSDDDLPDRNRGVTRARLRANYKVNSLFSVGTEISTGDSDDPNSVHVTLSDFADDFEISLSRLFARIDLENGVTLLGGKFANPFLRTDLVWDGDVNPQGAAAIFDLALTESIRVTTTGIYSILDEVTLGPDSDMIGGQINVGLRPNRNWQFSGAVSYYDYNLKALAGADAGDYRSNLRDNWGGYLSEYELLDLLGSASYFGLGERWPITISGDYVKNYGSAAGNDHGYSTMLTIGRTTSVHDWRLAYGYSQVGIDAVLGAFSNDNLAIATNYQSHLLGVDFTPFDHVVLNATLYHYKPLEAVYAGNHDPDDWLDRLRLNMTVSF